ncbi:MAG: GIY-YIG nuclease family protein [Nitriliruptorales bacterium]
MSLRDVPPEVRALYGNLEHALNTEDSDGRRFGDAKFGVYCFYDFDEEPIYVGQTREALRTRVRRHLTNQRTDAVAMFVLDPYEVHSLEMWPFWELEDRDARDPEAKRLMSRAEWTVYEQAVRASRFGAVLNEGDIARDDPIELPSSYRAVIAPAGWEDRSEHPDVRIARRAQTFWQLTKVASERDVSVGLLRTVVVQAQRLLFQAGQRYQQLGGTDMELDFGVQLPEYGETVPGAADEDEECEGATGDAHRGS